MEPCRKKRLLTILLRILAVLAAGLCYALWIRFTGLGLSCPIYTLTKWQCPGCGVSRMALALLQGDLAGAFSFNPYVLCLLPSFGVVLLIKAVIFVRTGSSELKRWEVVYYAVALAGALVFSVLRNLL